MKDTPEKIKEQLDRLYDAQDKLCEILDKAGRDSETQYKKRYLDILDVLRAFDRQLYKLLHDTYLSAIVDIDETANEKPLDAQGVELGCMGNIDIKSVSKVVGL